MTTHFEQAFPAGPWLSAEVRSHLAQCGIFASATAALTGEDFTIQPFAAIAVYGAGGGLTFYAYDSADTTTADDSGLTTIVVSGRRYKRAVDTIVNDAVLSATTTAQPASPALGDAYVLTASPSGTDWAAKAKNVATYTARGWVFRAPFTGQIVYAADEAGFRHYSAGGTWTTGLGAGGIGAGVITPGMFANPFAIMAVEDERNAPPGSLPAAGTLYQVGTSPTGAFAGHAKAIARATASAYEFFTPGEGATIYRKDVQALYSYRSGSWVLSVPESGVARVKKLAQGSQAQTSINGTRKLYSATVSFAATSGKTIRALVTKFEFVTGMDAGLLDTNVFELGLYKDTESTPSIVLGKTLLRTWQMSGGSAVAADSSAHTWQLGIRRVSGSTDWSATLTSADIFLEEVTLA